MFILHFFSGLISGTVGGMGMGGGTLLIPILTLIFGEEQKMAQTLNLLSFIPMALICLVIHLKNKFIRYKKVLYVIVPGIVTCVAGCFLARVIEGDILKKIFGGFLTLLAVFEFVVSLKNTK